MIVEDSITARELLTHLINRDRRLRLVAQVASAEQAMRTLPRVRPDIITMDIRLPGMDGYETTRLIMETHPTPIIVVAAGMNEPDGAASILALRAGALTVMEKPSLSSKEDGGIFGERLCNKLVVMSQVRVIRQRFNGPRRAARIIQPCASAPVIPCQSEGQVDGIGIVASTGGPAALETILSSLPADLPAPILLVQHISPSFLESFALWLKTICPMPVHIALNGARIERGCVYIAPQDRHLTVVNRRANLTCAPAEHNERPSGSVLLRSIAEAYGPRGVGVVLTGMGRDGADGLLAVREAGGHTIAQDEETSVVYGMPGESIAIGAAAESLPIHEIADRLAVLAGTAPVENS
ncbi:MAG: chemotaxis-specific protein-glutamate methyltransferase CheB [Planctomycetes bacterium]|nr:chemotaxis-specific protein-glutamate methyltransferase CheB [Planctomycetota bacterium]